MAKIVVSFDEMGGIAEFSGLPIEQASAAIINKAADFLDKFRFFGAGIDNYTNYSAVYCAWGARTVTFPIVLE